VALSGSRRDNRTRAPSILEDDLSSPKPVRTVLTIVMDALVLLAIAETVRLVVQFFGALANSALGKAIIALTNPITIPFGIESIKTPYGGSFEVNAALTVVAFLLVEWVLSIVRSRS